MTTNTSEFRPVLAIRAEINGTYARVQLSRFHDDYSNTLHFRINKTKLPTLSRQNRDSQQAHLDTATKQLCLLRMHNENIEEFKCVRKQLLNACSSLVHEASISPAINHAAVAFKNAQGEVKILTADTSHHNIKALVSLDYENMVYDGEVYAVPVCVQFIDTHTFPEELGYPTKQGSTKYVLFVNMFKERAKLCHIDMFYTGENNKDFNLIKESNLSISPLDFGISYDDFKEHVIANLYSSVISIEAYKPGVKIPADSYYFDGLPFDKVYNSPAFRAAVTFAGKSYRKIEYVA